MRGQITQQLFIRGSGPVLGHGWHLSRTHASKPLTGKAHYLHCGLVVAAIGKITVVVYLTA
jgi:hypothetical protein